MPGLGLSELRSYCFASNLVPDCEVICVSDLEVFVYMGSVAVPLCVGGWLWCAGVDVSCECACAGSG